MSDDLPTTFYPPNTNEPASPPPPVSSPTTGFTEEKPRSNKKVIVASLALILVVASTAVAVYLAGQRQEVRKEAEDVCNYPTYPDGTAHVCNGHAPGWSTCAGSRRWGCDQACNEVDLLSPWCEGDQQYKCENSAKTPDTSGSLHCGGTGPRPCDGRASGSYCDGVGDGNGRVRVLNCTGSVQDYHCQANQTNFDTQNACDTAVGTDQYTGDITLRVNSGEYGECSAGPDGCCGIGQADIKDITSTGLAVCWDIAKTCTCCGITPTPGLSCSGLTSQPAGSTRKPGESINLTCTGAGQGINHFEFRVTIGAGGPTPMPSVAASGTTGQISYEIPQYGCYKIECRACPNADTVGCTTWGKAKAE